MSPEWKHMAYGATREGDRVIREILKVAEPRPTSADTVQAKNQYAVRFADAMAAAIVDDLKDRMHGIAASAKRTAGAVGGLKQLDVNFSTPASGLLLGISLKSVHVREGTGARRYTHNMKRNEEELRIEASGYHKRQPYAVMVGVLFLPFDACSDGKRGNSSSFGSWIRHLRPYVGRSGPHDDVDRFERLFVGLYEPDGSDLRFFDVATAPPRNERPPLSGPLLDSDGRPRRAMTYGEFLDAIHRDYLRRNVAEFQWADGTEEPIEPDGPDNDESEDKSP
jgi:hypothetical protein